MGLVQGQKVAITGGGSGIGLAIARRLYAEGAQIAICDVNADALESVSSELPGTLTTVCDVSQASDVGRFFALIEAEWSGLDALINNAGIAGPTGGVDEITPDEFETCLRIGLLGQFNCAHFAVPLIRKNGGGSIVGMSSVAGKYGYAYRTPYSATKFGVVGLCQSLAKELGPENIRVNAIQPGFVSGPRMEGVITDRARQEGVPVETMRESYLSKVSMRRMVTEDDVANTVAFLLSPAGANLSGQNIAVDGNVETL